MELDKIDIKTFRQKVYEEFSESITRGEMLPGQTFSLRELAGKLGVSIMPVREALWQMESEKIIRIENNKKMSINTLSKKELQELYEIRLFLETELMEKGCENKTPAIIKKLESIYKQMLDDVTNFKKFLKFNKEFHFTIYEAAGCSIYQSMAKSLWLREAPYFALQHISPHLQSQISQHKKMLEAYKMGDKDKLTISLKEDMDGIIKFILPQLD